MKSEQPELFTTEHDREQGLYTTSYHENKVFTDLKILDISEYSFSSCVFTSCLFSETDLTDVTFEDCILKDCQLSLCKLYGTVFNNVQFRSSRLTGMNFTESSDFCFTPDFSSSLLDNCVFYNNTLNNLHFTDTTLRNTDFSNTLMKNTVFEDVRFQKCTFLGCNMEKADFRSARGYMIDPSANKLKGSRFSLPEAASFLKYLGISVE